MKHNQISINTIQQILETRMEQLNSVLTVEYNTRKQILNQISKLPNTSRKLSGFMDFMIDFTSNLSYDIWNAKKNEISNDIDDRIDNIAEKLGVKSRNVEDRIIQILDFDEDDYIKALKHMGAKPGHLADELEKSLNVCK